jgi:hypothetical protein
LAHHRPPHGVDLRARRTHGSTCLSPDRTGSAPLDEAEETFQNMNKAQFRAVLTMD